MARMWFASSLFAAIAAFHAQALPNEPGAPSPSPAAALAGEWGVQIKIADHTEEAVLDLLLKGAHLTGSLKRENQEPRDLTNIQFAGERISFDIDELTGTTRFQGVVDGDIMSGKWKRLHESGDDESAFSFGGPGASPRRRGGGERAGESGRSQDRGSHEWTAYRRHLSESELKKPASAETPLGRDAKASADRPDAAGKAADYRFHVSYGAISQKDAILLTPEGERVAFTSSFSIPDARFVPDPYAGKCKLTAVKFTLKEGDKKSILGDRYKPASLADQDDTMVPHSDELRNAAGKFGANSIYLLLSDSDELQNVTGLRDCTIVSKDGDRYRGEWLNEVACKNAEGKTFKFSRYAGRANFYSCGAAKK